MTTFTIDQDNAITVFATAEEAAAATSTPFDSFTSEKELAELIAGWPAERLIATYNSLPGVTPVKKFKTVPAAANKIWARIEKMGQPEELKAGPAGQPKLDKKVKAGAQAAKGALAKGKATKKATAPEAKPAAKVAKPKKTVAKAEKPAGVREGTKAAQVVAMLRRKNGATLNELASTFQYERHTIRGMVAGSLKKAGYKIESFKNPQGDRTYRITE